VPTAVKKPEVLLARENRLATFAVSVFGAWRPGSTRHPYMLPMRCWEIIECQHLILIHNGFFGFSCLAYIFVPLGFSPQLHPKFRKRLKKKQTNFYPCITFVCKVCYRRLGVALIYLNRKLSPGSTAITKCTQYPHNCQSS
jgi:hypothetical protein